MAGPDRRNGQRVPLGPLSRRELFPSVVGGAAILAAAISLGKSEVAEAQPKVSKTTAKYQDHPKGSAQCSECRFFRPPHACQLVSGNISPNGWCSFFAKKTA